MWRARHVRGGKSHGFVRRHQRAETRGTPACTAQAVKRQHALSGKAADKAAAAHRDNRYTGTRFSRI
jgi:hypothetical protein